MITNGFIVVKKTSEHYCGVERDVWPLQYENDNSHELLCEDEPNVGLLDRMTDNLSFAQRYLSETLNHGIEGEILYCEFVDNDYVMFSDKLEKVKHRCTYLGWDYSWSDGDFYSCVYNDFHKELFADMKCKLNEYGLFQISDDLDEFIYRREKLFCSCPKGIFEIGPFFKVKVFKL